MFQFQCTKINLFMVEFLPRESFDVRDVKMTHVFHLSVGCAYAVLQRVVAVS